MPDDESDLRDSEIALMDALKSVIEILIAKDIAKPEAIDKLLAGQQNGYVEKRMPSAVVVMGFLRSFVSDPERAAFRSEIRKLLKEPPKGSA
jgi:hypothetical protein